MDPKRCWRVCFFLLCLSCFSSVFGCLKRLEVSQRPEFDEEFGRKHTDSLNNQFKNFNRTQDSPRNEQMSLKQGTGPQKGNESSSNHQFLGDIRWFSGGYYILHISYHIWIHDEICTWNPKQPFINGCFNWMIPNLYIENGCFTKHPFINGCLGFQVVFNQIELSVLKDVSVSPS